MKNMKDMTHEEAGKLANQVEAAVLSMLPPDCTYLLQLFGPEENPHWWVGSNHEESNASEPIKELCKNTMRTVKS